MKLISRTITLLCCMHMWSLSFAAEPTPGKDGGGGSQNEMAKYILNLGRYLGYNLEKNPAEENKKETNQKLFEKTESILRQKNQLLKTLFDTFFGAILVDTAGVKTFVPDSNSYNTINKQANIAFKTPPYSSESQSEVSITPLIDQPTYQEDPVSQSILNILGTPSFTYCLDNQETVWDKCLYADKVRDREHVMSNVIGNDNVPDKDQYFTFEYNKAIIPQLNIESLIAPLLYSNEGEPASTSSSSLTGGNDKGLVAKNQLQQAANFIRYATSQVLPLPLTRRKDYSKLYDTMDDERKPFLERFRAQAAIAEYIAAVRVYAAQASVAISNFYTTFSRRMPQKATSETNAAPTSQALSEFTMATWRLFAPEDNQQNSNKKAWLDELNTASAASVQKEIAVLLAEINYQLYLSRQQQERILLTNSLLVMQNLKSARPTLNMPEALGG